MEEEYQLSVTAEKSIEGERFALMDLRDRNGARSDWLSERKLTRKE